jgi:hypothetical protein
MKLIEIRFLVLVALGIMNSHLAQASIMMPDNCENPLARTFLKYEVGGHYFNKKDKKIPINLVDVNRKLKQLGLTEFPKEVTLGLKSAGEWKTRYAKSIEALRDILGATPHLNIDGLYLYEAPEICYHGSATAVPELIVKLGHTFFHGGQGILAYRVGNVRKALSEDEYGFSSDYARTRKNYEENGYEGLVDEFMQNEPGSRDVLVYSNIGAQGDGTELYSTRIKPCASF